MSDVTPTTEYVRAQYARIENYDPYYEGDLYLTPDGQLSAEQFDRWLAEHDAEVAKAERERIAKAVWEEKQKVFEAITKDSTNSLLIAYQSGMWKAFDIINGENK